MDLIVPQYAVNLVIGRAGETFVRLQAQSLARIQCNADLGAPTRCITVTGTQAACDTAKRLIDEVIRTSPVLLSPVAPMLASSIPGVPTPPAPAVPAVPGMAVEIIRVPNKCAACRRPRCSAAARAHRRRAGMARAARLAS